MVMSSYPDGQVYISILVVRIGRYDVTNSTIRPWDPYVEGDHYGLQGTYMGT